MNQHEEFNKPIQHLREELLTLRTNRATPSLVEQLKVSVYGAMSPLIELASITVPEPQSLLIQPWDAHILKDIEKSIQESSLGIQPINDGKSLRLVMPQLTEERRKQLVKIIHQKSEECKIAIRAVREQEMKETKRKEHDGDISEDQSMLDQKNLQKRVESAIQEVEDLAKLKEHEILSPS